MEKGSDRNAGAHVSRPVLVVVGDVFDEHLGRSLSLTCQVSSCLNSATLYSLTDPLSLLCCCSCCCCIMLMAMLLIFSSLLSLLDLYFYSFSN